MGDFRGLPLVGSHSARLTIEIPNRRIGTCLHEQVTEIEPALRGTDVKRRIPLGIDGPDPPRLDQRRDGCQLALDQSEEFLDRKTLGRGSRLPFERRKLGCKVDISGYSGSVGGPQSCIVQAQRIVPPLDQEPCDPRMSLVCCLVKRVGRRAFRRGSAADVLQNVRTNKSHKKYPGFRSC